MGDEDAVLVMTAPDSAPARPGTFSALRLPLMASA